MELVKCEFCPYKTPHADHLSRHISAVHEGVKSFKCGHCGYGTHERAQLEDHRARHHRWDETTKSGWRHKCHVCPYKTTCRNTLVEHLNNVHTTIRDYKCDLCDYAAKKKYLLDKHKRSVHEGKTEFEFKCEQCHYECKRKKNLVDHVRKSHNGVDTNIRADDFKCDKCDYSHHLKESLTYHKVRSHQAWSLKKERRGQKKRSFQQLVQSDQQLATNIGIKQVQVSDPRTSGEFFKDGDSQMSEADQDWGSEETLPNIDRHGEEASENNEGHKDQLVKPELDHYDEEFWSNDQPVTRISFRRFNCKYCSFKSSKMDAMSKHTWTAHKVMWNKDFKCDKCENTFYSIEALERHEVAMNHNSQMSESAQEQRSKDFKCKKCAQTFYSTEALERHEIAMFHNFQKMPKADQNGDLKETTSCLDQQEYWVAENHYILKAEPAQGLTQYSCKSCSFKSSRMDLMSRHMRTAHKVMWNCEFCQYKTLARLDLLAHKRANHKDFKCDQCSFAFYSSDKLARHKVAMNHDRQEGTTKKPHIIDQSRACLYKDFQEYRCERCTFTCYSMIILDRHKRAMKHKWDDEVVNEMESISSGSNAVKCDKCSFTCPDKGSLDGHMTALHYGGGKRYKCEKCDFVTKKKFLLVGHKKGSDCDGSKKTKEGPEIRIFECGYCSFSARSDTELAAHVENMHVKVSREENGKSELNEIFMCTKCDNAFNSVDALQRHEVAMNHNCQQLPKTDQNNGLKETTSSINQQEKSNINEGTKDYKCDLCDFSCGEKEQLLDHVRFECRGEMQDEEVPVGQVEDQHSSTSSENAQYQQVTGSNPEIFQCNLCTTSFLSAPELHQHLFRHTGEEFTCNLCFKRTSSRIELDYHRKYSHTSNRVMSTVLEPY